MSYWAEVVRMFVENLRWQDFADILLVSFILYRLFILIKGTRAVQLLRGMLLLFAAYMVSRALGLNTITWLVSSMATMIIVAIPVVFQPELRRALSLLGQGELFRNDVFGTFEKEQDPVRICEELSATIRQLSSHKIGALIVLERQTGLNEFAETGTPIGAVITSELLVTIFFPNSPLHDGAVILRGDRILTAGSLLPLTESYRRSGKRHIGTRHRAAIGLTETSDAIAIVVSEETGVISIALKGVLQRHIGERELKEVLEMAYLPSKSAKSALNPVKNGFPIPQWLGKRLSP